MAKMEFPLRFKRQYAGSLDVDEVFETSLEMEEYLTDPARYAGQMATCLEEEGVIYVLNNALDEWLVAGDGEGEGSALLEKEVQSMIEVGQIKNGEVIEKETSFTDFVKRLLLTTYQPEFQSPSVSLSSNSATRVEAGTVKDLVLSVNFDKGSILGDFDADGVWQFEEKQNNRAGEADEFTIQGANLGLANEDTLVGYTVSEGENNFTASVSHLEGPQPYDSDEGNYGSPLAAGVLGAEMIIYGKRNLFYGSDVVDGDPYTVSDEIRELSNTYLNPSNNTSFTINIPAGAKKVVFAYPATIQDVSSVTYVEGMNAEVRSAFDKEVFEVEGANGYNPIDYKVYTFTPSAPFENEATYDVTI